MRIACKTDLEFQLKKADRSICPRKHDFGRLYADYRREKYGGKNGELMFQALDARVKQYCEENSDSSVEFQKYVECGENVTPFILAIVTPLMKRVHEKVGFLYVL